MRFYACPCFSRVCKTLKVLFCDFLKNIFNFCLRSSRIYVFLRKKKIEALFHYNCSTLNAIHFTQCIHFFFLSLCLFFVLMHSRKKSDSEDEGYPYKQSSAIVANQPRPSFEWNSSCRRDQSYKPTAEYVGSSLTQITEGKILEASDQPRLILLHELYSCCIRKKWLDVQQLNEIKLHPVMSRFFVTITILFF